MQLSIKEAISNKLYKLKRVINKFVIPMTLAVFGFYIAIFFIYASITKLKYSFIHLFSYVKSEIYINEVKNWTKLLSVYENYHKF